MLRALPGVTESNYLLLAAKVLCLQDLFVMPLAALQAIIGPENGRKLHAFINTQASVDLCRRYCCRSSINISSSSSSSSSGGGRSSSSASSLACAGAVVAVTCYSHLCLGNERHMSQCCSRVSRLSIDSVVGCSRA